MILFKENYWDFLLRNHDFSQKQQSELFRKQEKKKKRILLTLYLLFFSKVILISSIRVKATKLEESQVILILFKNFSFYCCAEIPKNTAEEKQSSLVFLLILFQDFIFCDIYWIGFNFPCLTFLTASKDNLLYPKCQAFSISLRYKLLYVHILFSHTEKLYISNKLV